VKLDKTIAELNDTKSNLEAETVLRKHHQEAELKISKFCDYISSILTQAVDHIDSINQVVSDAFTKEKNHIQIIEALKFKLAEKLTNLENNVTDAENTLRVDINDFIENFSRSTDSSKNQLDQIGATIDKVTKGLENENMAQLRQSLASTFNGFQDVISKLRSIEVDVLSGFKDRLGLLKTSTTQSISLVVKDIDTLSLTLSQNFERIDNNTSKAFSNLQTSLLEQLSLLDNIKNEFSGKIGTSIEHFSSLDDKLHRLMTEQIEKSSVFKNKFMEFITDAHNRQVQEFESIVSAMKHEFATSVNAVQLLKDSHTSDLQKLRSALQDHTSKKLDISRASLSKDIKQIGLKHTEEVEEFKKTSLQKIDTEISSLVIREVDYVEAETSQLNNTIALEQSRCDYHQTKANEATENISSGLVKNLQMPISAELEALKKHVLQAHSKQCTLLDALSTSTSGKLSTVAHGLGESGRIVQTIKPNDFLTTNSTDLKRSRTKSEYLEEISKMDRPKRTKL
jgi:kinesin family protein 11